MLHRRELLLVGAGALVTKATASTLACANEGPPPNENAAPTKAAAKPEDPHAGHAGHEGHEGGGVEGSGPSADQREFASVAAECVAAGEACLAHCLRILGEGDTSMADCSKAVNVMLAVCRGTGVVAVNASAHLTLAAKLCHEVCKDCSAACEPHVGHHAECKACFEACKATMAVAAKFV